MHTHAFHRTDSKDPENSCPRRVNTGNKNTPGVHHPRRRNLTTSMVGLKKERKEKSKQTKNRRSNTQKSHPNGEPQ